MNNSLAQRFFDLDLWLIGGAHFVILFASSQVPYRLGWKKDLRQLMPFNRKVLWVQGGFTVLTIIAFGTFTLLLHAELLRGDRAALGIACFIGIYWTTRILVDFLIGRALLFARGLAQGNGIYCGTRTPDSSVLGACRKLRGAIRLARLAAAESLTGKGLTCSA